MKLKIDTEIRKNFPELRIGVIVVENITNDVYPNELEEYCKKSFNNFAKNYADAKELKNEKNIIAWQEIYRSFGSNPKKKKPTAESLLTRAIKSGFYPYISPAVDSYLIAETIHLLPIGRYDLNKIDENIILKYSIGDEDFIGVGSDISEPTYKGEIIYSDNSRVLTRRWNYKDCDYSKIDTNTKDIALFVEAPVKIITDKEIYDTLNEIEKNLVKYCNPSKTTIVFLDKDSNEIELK